MRVAFSGLARGFSAVHAAVHAAVFAAALALVCVPPAQAHDSWFQLGLPGAPGQAQVLSLGTGQRYPAQQTAIAPEYLDQQGCRPTDAPGGERFMRPLGYQGTQALLLQPPPGARSCWVQLVPLDVDVAPQLVDGYLREIRASAETLTAWQTQRRQGLPWRERYTKHVRIDFGSGAAASAGAAPVPLGMDLVQRPGGQLQVLRDGLPLAGQAVELLSDDAPFGVWRRSDETGQLALGPLPAGRWLARAVDLRPREGLPGQWDSRFVTLAFERGPGLNAAAP
jgi:hypothetical protein